MSHTMIECSTSNNLHLLLLAQIAANGTHPGFIEDVAEDTPGHNVQWKHRSPASMMAPTPVFRPSSVDLECVFVGYHCITVIKYFLN